MKVLKSVLLAVAVTVGALGVMAVTPSTSEGQFYRYRYPRTSYYRPYYGLGGYRYYRPYYNYYRPYYSYRYYQPYRYYSYRPYYPYVYNYGYYGSPYSYSGPTYYYNW